MKLSARYFGTPLYLILFVTDKCWMKCMHCWFNEDWKSQYLVNNMMSLEEIKKIADSSDKIYFLSLTGGEAFSREDITDIVKIFTSKKKTKRYQIPTSGYKTDLIIDRTITMLEQNPSIPFRVDVSLDGDRVTHDRIRGMKGAFDNAVDTITELNKLKKHYTYFDAGVITTISIHNENIVSDISGIIEKIHPEGEWMINITRGKPRAPDSGNINPENYLLAHKIIEDRIKKGKYKGHSGHFTSKWLTAKNIVRRKAIMKILDGKYKGGGCSAGSLAGVVFSDGSVYPCEMYDKKIGNLIDFDFNLKHLWNSEKADYIRKEIQSKNCYCTQECFLSVNFLIQPCSWAYIIKERIKYAH